MFHMKVIKAKTHKEAGYLAADEFEKVMGKKADCVIGLATGSTPLPFYDELIQREKNRALSFSSVRTVNLDEYVGLEAEDPQSYRYYMQKNLFDHISIKKENILIPNGLEKDKETLCRKYENQIEVWGGIDIQLLGIGHNGHIGFNEPDDFFAVSTHEVKLTEKTRKANQRFFKSPNDVPKSAITVGIGTIMSAKKIVMMAVGGDKAEIIKKAFCGPVTPKIPASILQFHPNVTLICDEAAYMGFY